MAHRGFLKKNETGWSVKYEISDWTARWFIGTGQSELPVLTENNQDLNEGESVSFNITEDGFAKIIREQ